MMRPWTWMLPLVLVLATSVHADTALEEYKKLVQSEARKAVDGIDKLVSDTKAEIATATVATKVESLGNRCYSTTKFQEAFYKATDAATKSIFKQDAATKNAASAFFQTTSKELNEKSQEGCLAISNAAKARLASLVIPLKLNGALTKSIDNGSTVTVELVTQINAPLWVSLLTINHGGKQVAFEADVYAGTGADGSKHKQRWKATLPKPAKGRFTASVGIGAKGGNRPSASRTSFDFQI